MKYSKKTTISTVVVIVFALSGLGTYMDADRQHTKPISPPVGADSIASPTAMSPTKAFSGIEGMKILYPSPWTASPASTNATNSQQKIVAFQSPSTMTETNPQGDEKVVKGAKIVFYENKFSSSHSIEEFKSSDNFIWKYAKNKSETVINGTPVLQFDATYEGSQRHYAVFYRDGREYMLILDEEVYKKSEQRTVFDNMLKNLEFNKSP